MERGMNFYGGRLSEKQDFLISLSHDLKHELYQSLLNNLHNNYSITIIE